MFGTNHTADTRKTLSGNSKEERKKRQTSILNSLDRVTYFAIKEQIFAVRSPFEFLITYFQIINQFFC